jgi:hypothetical protein
MTPYAELFLAWLITEGKITIRDIAEYNRHVEDTARLCEAKEFIANNFKGMF